MVDNRVRCSLCGARPEERELTGYPSVGFLCDICEDRQAMREGRY